MLSYGANCKLKTQKLKYLNLEFIALDIQNDIRPLYQKAFCKAFHEDVLVVQTVQRQQSHIPISCLV